jgi:hypothetical protein
VLVELGNVELVIVLLLAARARAGTIGVGGRTTGRSSIEAPGA